MITYNTKQYGMIHVQIASLYLEEPDEVTTQPTPD
jgi:hypothetical protein